MRLLSKPMQPKFENLCLKFKIVNLITHAVLGFFCLRMIFSFLLLLCWRIKKNR